MNSKKLSFCLDIAGLLVCTRRDVDMFRKKITSLKQILYQQTWQQCNSITHFL
jgi:hypothetical protein